MKTKLFIGMTVLMLLVSACGVAPVFGSGKVVTETRDVSGFDKVSVSGGGELVIIQDGTESVTVETDDNLMQYVVAEVRGGTLNLYLDNDGMSNFQPTRLVFTVHVKNLTGVTTSGAWDFTAAEIETDNLDISVSGTGSVDIGMLTANNLTVTFGGAGEMDAAGQVTSQSVTIGGTGEYRAADLKSETAEVKISGTGEATLWVTDSLTVDISGAGSVQYYGSPQTNINTSGAGDVQRLGDK
ncbi:MAG: hypothetical protein FD146_120 [Anaerolineaceae bacterium]|nr:MAG: hypothetical protein FD146_120 [Anaerolineaceae bacterium]